MRLLRFMCIHIFLGQPWTMIAISLSHYKAYTHNSKLAGSESAGILENQPYPACIDTRIISSMSLSEDRMPLDWRP